MTDRTSPETERLRQFAAYGDPAEGRILAQLALTEIERLLPYVEAFRREETRADKLGRELDDLRGLAQTPDLRKVLRSLCNEIEGIWDAFEYGLRAEISNTNYAVVRDKIEEARRILASPDTSTLQAKEEN